MSKLSFLKPTPLKFILPVIFVLITISVFFLTKDLNNQISDYPCKIVSLKDQINGFQLEGNIISLNEVKFKTDELQKEILQKIEDNQLKFAFVVISNRLITKVNPIYPPDCSFAGTSSLCSFYTSKNSYECAKILLAQSNQTTFEFGPIILNSNIPKYKQPNNLLFILSLVYIFIVGYLISCIFSFIFKRIKNNISK